MQTFRSGGKTIAIEVIDPRLAEASTRNRLAPAILLLHGSGGNVSFWFNRFAPHLTRLGIGLYAVHYFDRTGTTRADAATIQDGRHFPLWLDTIRDTLRYIASRPGIDSKRISLLGISLGAFLALSLAADESQAPAVVGEPQVQPRVRAIVEISGGLPPPYSTHATAAYPPTLILHGDADTVVPVAEAHELNHLLDRLGTPHQLQLFPGEGHWFSSAAQFGILTSVARFLSTYL